MNPSRFITLAIISLIASSFLASGNVNGFKGGLMIASLLIASLALGGEILIKKLGLVDTGAKRVRFVALAVTMIITVVMVMPLMDSIYDWLTKQLVVETVINKYGWFGLVAGLTILTVFSFGAYRYIIVMDKGNMAGYVFLFAVAVLFGSGILYFISNMLIGENLTHDIIDAAQNGLENGAGNLVDTQVLPNGQRVNSLNPVNWTWFGLNTLPSILVFLTIGAAILFGGSKK